ncbi:hypothetical protein IFM89_003074 [Coptis chinensis]|uniref:Uncharacterized protein n=1 Tax=Coptis chinensis TaxID=261450 RepID=A0A835I9G2_9MAGN|nr:hypothetical protein IFM89_003074 [Coptis chinensis]
MHRSASTSRASDEFFINLSPASKGSPGVKVADVDNLAAYDPIADISKKEITSHIKSSGENSIHIIPIVLIVCAITLWVFSHPVVDLTKTADVAAVKVEGANIHNHGNKTGLSSTVNLKNLDQQEGTGKGKTDKFLEKNSG